MAHKTLLGLSLIVHGALAVLIGRIEVKKSLAATAIEISEAKQPQKKPPPPAEVVPEPPRKAEKQAARKLAAKAPAEPPPAPVPAANPQAALAALPDFGLSLSGAAVGGGGVAVPAGSPTGVSNNTRPSPAPVKRALSAAAAPVDECAEGPAKPKPLNVPQPAYTDQARAAGVEGKVRVELTVDETGRVVNVRVLSGLGHGLDEAALSAARRATFQPAVRCGKATRATFTISMRFAAS
jgi:protein TonB